MLWKTKNKQPKNGRGHRDVADMDPRNDSMLADQRPVALPEEEQMESAPEEAESEQDEQEREREELFQQIKADIHRQVIGKIDLSRQPPVGV